MKKEWSMFSRDNLIYLCGYIIIAIYTMVVLLIEITNPWFTVHDTINDAKTLKQNFCMNGTLIEDGTVNYCSGRAFVCSKDKCEWLKYGASK